MMIDIYIGQSYNYIILIPFIELIPIYLPTLKY